MAIDTLPKIEVLVPTPIAHYSLEGVDGMGKTTQFTNLERELIAKNIPIQLGKSPSPTLIGEFLRANMSNFQKWERNTLFLMDMIAILKENEGSGKFLLWDRYKDSNRVANKDMTLEEAEKSVLCLPETTKTFLLDMDPSLVVSQRGESLHGHSLDIEWQLEKRRRYLELAERDSDRIVVIDASKPREEITNIITEIIVDDLRSRGLV